MAEVPYTPEHCNTINTYLFVDDGKTALEFYAKMFGGEPQDMLEAPDGSLMHGALRIGNSMLMVSQANPDWGTHSPKALGGSPASLHIYVADPDAAFKKAVDCGCKEVSPMMDCFWGERMGKVECPFGFQWSLSKQTEILTADEMQKRGAEWMQKMEEGGAPN